MSKTIAAYVPTRGRSATTGDLLPVVRLDVTSGEWAGWEFSLWWPGTLPGDRRSVDLWSFNFSSPGDEADPIRTRYVEGTVRGANAWHAVREHFDLWPEIAEALLVAAEYELGRRIR